MARPTVHDSKCHLVYSHVRWMVRCSGTELYGIHSLQQGHCQRFCWNVGVHIAAKQQAFTAHCLSVGKWKCVHREHWCHPSTDYTKCSKDAKRETSTQTGGQREANCY